MRVFLFSLFLFYSALSPLLAEVQSFDEIFPGLSPAIRESAFSTEGYFKSHRNISLSSIIGSSQSTLDPHILNTVFSKKPGFLVESIFVIPSNEGEYTLLDIYNALGKIRALEGRLYRSHTRNDDVPLFEEATRIESARRNVPVSDPAPAAIIPASETIYMRLKDINFGNSFYRGLMALEPRGLRYSLTNNRTLSYLLMPVIREERFTALLYFEPIAEGILIYALAGADVSNFISSRIDMASAISKRLAVIIAWVSDGIQG